MSGARIKTPKNIRRLSANSGKSVLKPFSSLKWPHPEYWKQGTLLNIFSQFFYAIGYGNNCPVITRQNHQCFRWFLRAYKVLSAESLYGIFSACVYELIIWRINTFLQSWMNPPHLRRQWQDVLEECRQAEAGPEERLRIALLNVDYVISFELPFRLLLTRTPQLIAACVKNGTSARKIWYSTINVLAAYTAWRPVFPVCRIHTGIICLIVFVAWLRMKTHHRHISRLPGKWKRPVNGRSMRWRWGTGDCSGRPVLVW